MRDELRGESYHFLREVLDDGFQASKQVFVLERAKHLHIYFQDTSEMWCCCLKRGPVMQKGSEC